MGGGGGGGAVFWIDYSLSSFKVFSKIVFVLTFPPCDSTWQTNRAYQSAQTIEDNASRGSYQNYQNEAVSNQLTDGVRGIGKYNGGAIVNLVM